jgi:GAF domain-containing protein
MDELLAADEPSLAGQLDEYLDDVAVHAEYRRLTAEHAALRRVATLVARGVEPSEVFDAVTNEMCRCVGGECAGLYRYETSGEITLVAGAYLHAAAPVQWPVGTRTPVAGNTLASTVLRTGGPARSRCARQGSELLWASP